MALESTPKSNLRKEENILALAAQSSQHVKTLTSACLPEAAAAQRRPEPSLSTKHATSTSTSTPALVSQWPVEFS